MEQIAEALIAKYKFLAEGFSLQRSSGIWAKANGLYTVRLVYRSDRGSSLVFSFTNIALKHHIAEELL